MAPKRFRAAPGPSHTAPGFPFAHWQTFIIKLTLPLRCAWLINQGKSI
jgi:hypothetical protein